MRGCKWKTTGSGTRNCGEQTLNVANHAALRGRRIEEVDEAAYASMLAVCIAMTYGIRVRSLDGGIETQFGHRFISTADVGV